MIKNLMGTILALAPVVAFMAYNLDMISLPF